ncbi:MAG TPA: type II secretion system protein [Caulobacteraceae bacterium]
MSATGRVRDRGTTLIEALVVIAIVGLVAAIGFPRLQNSLATMGWRETVAVVTTRLRQVRADALRTDRPAAFVIAADGHGFSAPGGGTVATPAGVELSSPTGKVIGFYGDGSSSGGAIWVSAGRRGTPVRVSPGTGAVSVGGG